MHFALMIYYSPEEFALRKNDISGGGELLLEGSYFAL